MTGTSDTESSTRARNSRLVLFRDARLFMRRPELRDTLADIRRTRELAQDELLKLTCPGDFVVRLGRLRLTEFLPDGREVTMDTSIVAVIKRSRVRALLEDRAFRDELDSLRKAGRRVCEAAK